MYTQRQLWTDNPDDVLNGKVHANEWETAGTALIMGFNPSANASQIAESLVNQLLQT